MKRWIAGSTLIVVGLVIVAMMAAVGASAQTTGTCYVLDGSHDCSSEYTASLSCDACLALGFPNMSWEQVADADKSDCYQDAGSCPNPTAVTFLGFTTPITSCNAGWTVPGFALLGLVVAAGGLVVLKRR